MGMMTAQAQTVLTEEQQQLEQAQKQLEAAKKALEAVSYTHLIANTMDEWLVFSQSFISLDRTEFKYQLIARISAVSYTHLDVYKRQIINSTPISILPILILQM